MQEQTMQKAVILPVSDTLILPRAGAYVPVSEMSKLYRDYLENPGVVHIAVPLRKGGDGSREEDYHSMGVTFTLKNFRETEKGILLEIDTLERVRVMNFDFSYGISFADHHPQPDRLDLDAQMQEQMLSYMKDIVKDISSRFRGAEQYTKALDNIHDVDAMIVWLSRYIPMSADKKYEFLEIDSLRERSLHFLDVLLKQREALDWNIELNERISDQNNKYYRKQILREQMKAIQEELGEEEGGSAGKKDYKKRIEEAGMPEEVREAALEELSKMNSQQQGSPEISVIQNHLDFMLALPWKHEKTEDPDLVKARQILNEDHYGLEKVKKRILEHLAVMKLRKDNKGSILLLVGPPGTGKTSLGRSIARALDRKYVRLSLGGIRDESEIRGHRRTYVGAMPGRILNGMKQAGTTNPVMVLDEVDKLMAGGFSGDPSAALLEVLDPEQNSTFTDHYLDLPYDLSEVFFIATANTIDTIPGPLLDRMEVISISSYTEAEKYHIAAEHLLPEVLEETGLSKDQIEIPEDVLRAVITDYTREGGVRGLKKQLLAIARSVSAELVTGTAELPRVIRKEELEELTGHRPAFHDKTGVDNPPGVVTGLAWTAVGGEILFIETQDMPGSGQVILTGQLGDVMQESARISLSLLKSRLPLSTVNFKERDVHIHVPSGAVPKDGPSAGITIFTALASLFTGHKVDPHLAMTGEITLRGAVMPIGGLKEKLLAALRAGITKALIPKDNEADLREVPDEVKEKMTIIPVATVEDVLRETIGISLPKMEHMLYNGAPGALRSDLTQN